MNGRSAACRCHQPDRAAKCRAIDAYTSQLEPSPDGRPVVPAELVHRLRIDDEVLLAGRRAA